MIKFFEALQALGVFFIIFWACGADSMELPTLFLGMAIGLAVTIIGAILERSYKKRKDEEINIHNYYYRKRYDDDY